VTPRLRFALSAVLAAIVFGVGYWVAILIPGAGSSTDKDFTDFYNSDGKMAIATVLFFVLVAGCLAMLWFFNELRARLPEGMLTRIGYAAAVVGVVAVPAGAAIMMGPTGGQQNSNTSNAGFVGIPVAHAFASAGLYLILGVGMTGFALAALMMSLAARRGVLLPNWLVVVGVILAILTLGSFFWIPGYAFLIWVVIVGIVVGIRDDPAAAHA
jgi:hypothetical protein